MTRTLAPIVRSSYLLALFLIGFVLPLAGQTISQVVFLPQTYYVGDRVEARVVVRNIEVEDVVVPTELPDTQWVTIESLTTVQRADGIEVRILFQPFFVGTRELPPIDIEAVLITGVTAFVTSVTPPGTDPQPASIRDQLVLPGTQLQIAIGLFVIIAVPTIVLVAGGWGRRSLRRIARWYRENRPYRTFTKLIKALVNEMHRVDGKTFYIQLLDTCRTYLDGRFGVGVRSATTGEMDHVLSRAEIEAGLRTRIVELFRFGDLVKFAGRRVTLEERSKHVEEVRAIVETLQRHGPGGPDVDS